MFKEVEMLVLKMLKVVMEEKVNTTNVDMARVASAYVKYFDVVI